MLSVKFFKVLSIDEAINSWIHQVLRLDIFKHFH